MQNGLSVLIVDDEPSVRSVLEQGLKREAHKISVACDAAEAFEKFRLGDYEVVISGVHLLSDGDGLSLVSQILKHRPETTAIVTTPVGGIGNPSEAIDCGAFDFITKPLDTNLIGHQIRKVVERHRLMLEIRRLKDRLAGLGEISAIVGNSPAMQTVYSQVQQVADSSATVLIHGEAGTGKELIARAIHDLGSRGMGPFVSVNLATLPEALFSEVLFGKDQHRGNATIRPTLGRVEQAAEGTLFLDSLADMHSSSQLTLLKMLETGRYTRVDGDQEQFLQCRVVSATHCELRSLILEKSFRGDLFERLNVVSIEIPPLRERPEDIPLLVDHYLKHFCEWHKREPKRISDNALQVLCAAKWPGNVRELVQLVERLVLTLSVEVIDVSDVIVAMSKVGSSAEVPVKSLADATEMAERDAIQVALKARNHHREQTAQALGISLRTLHYKMSRYGLH